MGRGRGRGRGDGGGRKGMIGTMLLSVEIVFVCLTVG